MYSLGTHLYTLYGSPFWLKSLYVLDHRFLSELANPKGPRPSLGVPALVAGSDS